MSGREREISADDCARIRDRLAREIRFVEPPQRLFLDPRVPRFVRASALEMDDQLVNHRGGGELIASLGVARDVRQVQTFARADERFEEQILVALTRADVARLAVRECQVERVRSVNGRKSSLSQSAQEDHAKRQ